MSPYPWTTSDRLEFQARQRRARSIHSVCLYVVLINGSFCSLLILLYLFPLIVQLMSVCVLLLFLGSWFYCCFEVALLLCSCGCSCLFRWFPFFMLRSDGVSCVFILLYLNVHVMFFVGLNVMFVFMVSLFPKAWPTSLAARIEIQNVHMSQGPGA